MGELTNLVTDVLGHVATSEYERWRKKSDQKTQITNNLAGIAMQAGDPIIMDFLAPSLSKAGWEKEQIESAKSVAEVEGLKKGVVEMTEMQRPELTTNVPPQETGETFPYAGGEVEALNYKKPGPSKEQQYARAAGIFVGNQGLGMTRQQNIANIIARTGSLPPQFLSMLPRNDKENASIVALTAQEMISGKDGGEHWNETLQDLLREEVISTVDFKKLSPKERARVKKEVRDRANIKASAAFGYMSDEWAKYLGGGGDLAARQKGREAYETAWGKEAAESEAWGGKDPAERLLAKEELKTPVIGLEQVKGRAILKGYVETMDTIRNMIDFGKRTTPSRPGEFFFKAKDNFTNMESGSRRRFRNIVARLPGLMYAMRGKQLSDKELEVALDMMPQMGFNDEAFIEAFVAFEEYMLETEATWTRELSEAGYREPRKAKYQPGSPEEKQLHQKLKAHGINPNVIKITE